MEFASPYLHQHRPLSPRGDSHPGGFQRLQVPAGWEEGEAAPAHVLVAGAGDGEAATGGWPEEPAEGCSDGRRAVRVGARQRDREMPATLLTQQLWKRVPDEHPKQVQAHSGESETPAFEWNPC